jgi:hypothetical protein
MSHPPLRDRVKATPFVPFAVTLSDGRQVRVTGPEMIILGKRWARRRSWIRMGTTGSS